MRVENKTAYIQQSKTNKSKCCTEKACTHLDEKQSSKVKVASFVGSTAGIALSIAGILYGLKKSGSPTKFMNLRYGEKEVIALGASSIVGGLAGGSLFDKKSNLKPKLREGIRQLAGNILAPVGLLAVNLKLLEKSKLALPLIKESSKAAKALNPVIKGLPRMLVTCFSLVAGMEIGNTLINKVNNKVFNENEVKHTKPSDYSAHADDICFASTFMFNNPAIQSFVSKILPATFLVAGYETGTKAPEHKEI